MSNDSTMAVYRHTLAIGTTIALGLVAAPTARAQFASAIDLSSRTARPGLDAWQNQLSLEPFARFDHARFSVDGRWMMFGAEGKRIDGVGSATATYYSPSLSGFQVSVAGFAARDLLNETFAVSKFGTDARLSYKTARSGVWLGREISRDNKSTPISSAPVGSAGAWRQWGNTVATVSLSSFGGREQVRTMSSKKIPNPAWAGAPQSVRDTLKVKDSISVPVSDSSNQRRGWSDAEFSLNWGVGRLAFRGVVGARLLTARQPNEVWGQVQGTYSLANDVALVASGGVHPSAAAYGVSRARYMQLGVRIAPSALLKPRLPSGVRPAVVAFEVATADRGRRTLRIRVPSARTVELSGDFTSWKPITLERGDDDRWEATLPIPPGMHRITIRVDGDAWTPPPGVTTVADEFQGTVGVIVVK